MASIPLKGKHLNRQNLAMGPIGPGLFNFALPTMVANILQSLNGSINAMWVGHLVGPAGLAATANANMLNMMIGALGSGIGLSVTIFIAQAAGRGDHATMRRMVGAGAFIFMVLGSLAALGGWIFAPALLRWLVTPEPIYPLALAYARVIFLGQPLALFLVLLQQSVRGTGDAVTPLLFLVPSAIISATLNPLLILGFGPLPAAGIAGSAMANILGSCASLTLLLLHIYRRDLPLRLARSELGYLLPKLHILKSMVTKGLPAGVQMAVVAAASLAIIGLVNREGTETAAAYGAVNQLWTYLQMPALAIGSAATTMAAHSIGAGRWDRIGKIAGTGILLNLGLTAAALAVLWIGDRALLSLFVQGNENVIATARHINRLSSWSYLLTGAMMVLSSIPRANGATLPPLVIMIIAFFPGRLGAVHLLSPYLGADAIWWSFPIGAAISLVLTSLYFRYGGWRGADLLGDRTNSNAAA